MVWKCVEAVLPSATYFFADDTLIFNRGNEAEVRNILAILLSYCKASAQLLNFNKLVCFFSRITPSSERNRLSQILGIWWDANLGNYLGLLTELVALDIRHFSYVEDKLRSKLDGWNDHTLNPEGKEVMLSLWHWLCQIMWCLVSSYRKSCVKSWMGWWRSFGGGTKIMKGKFTGSHGITLCEKKGGGWSWIPWTCLF